MKAQRTSITKRVALAATLTLSLATSVTAPAQPRNQSIEQRYGVQKKEVVRSPNLRLPVVFHMTGHKTLAPKASANPAREMKSYDVAIVGGGPAGLTAALYLAEAGHSVIILERNPKLGGLGMGNELKGVRAGGGAAYSAGPEGDFEKSIFEKIGLGDYTKSLAIEEPIDSYLWNGVLYKGIWEDHTLEHLPPSFALFKYALLKLVELGAGDGETALGRETDLISMHELVSRRMPEFMAKQTDPKAAELLRKFETDSRLSRMPKERRMDDVIGLLDLYGRSALGGVAREISARQFIDFYESEIFTRYTGTLGTGTISEAIVNKLKAHGSLVDARVSAPVSSVENTTDGTKTVFVENGVTKEVLAKKVIFAAPLSLAPRLIKGLDTHDPKKVQAIKDIKMTDYAVHVVRVKGHPFRATYDTWSYGGGDLTKPTDFILGRWQDPRIKAYHDTREFNKNPADDYGIISIYQPLGASDSKHFNKAENLVMVENAVTDMMEKLGPLVAKDNQKIEIELIESYRWPDSIHVVSPGYLQKIPLLARPTGNIHYANNTVNAPELETAMGRAASEAIRISASMKCDASFNSKASGQK